MDEVFVRDGGGEGEQPKKAGRNIPGADYLKIKLSSAGRLTFPSIVHFRDYSASDALQMASAGDQEIVEAMIKILGNMVFEGLDCSCLHEKEMEEIMLNVFANWWTPTLDLDYKWTPEELNMIPPERAKAIKAGEEKPSVQIPISSIKTRMIDEKFKEPFSITIGSESIVLTLPRLQHTVKASSYVEKKYLREEDRFARTKAIIEDNRGKKIEDQTPIPNEELRAFVSYQKARALDFLMVKQAQLLVRHNKTSIDGVDQQLSEYKKIGLHFWNRFNQICKNEAFFGVEEEQEMESPLTGQPVRRPFRLDFTDLIPDMDAKHPEEYTLSFGDERPKE